MSDRVPPLPPVVGPSDSWVPTSATFRCDRCGGDACRVTLLPPLARDPNLPLPGMPGAIPGDGTLFPKAMRLSIDGPVTITHTFVDAALFDVAALETAITASDAAALFAIDLEYAPFWCPDCEKSFCRRCWVVWVDDDEGFYDCTRGRCPEGHARIMDD